jgi:hypothetical protein
MNNLNGYADCGDAPGGCDWPGGDFPTSGHIRQRPTRNHLLALLAQNSKKAVANESICQSDCSHCYAGHCGTSLEIVTSH